MIATRILVLFLTLGATIQAQGKLDEMPLRVHLLITEAARPGKPAAFRGIGVFGLDAKTLAEVRSQGIREVELDQLAGRRLRGVDIEFSPSEEGEDWFGRLHHDFRGYEGDGYRLKSLPAIDALRYRIWLGRRVGRAYAVLWIPGPQEQRENPEIWTPEEYAAALVDTYLTPGDGDRPDRMGDKEQRLDRVGRFLLNRTPLAKLIDEERADALRERLRPWRRGTLEALVGAFTDSAGAAVANERRARRLLEERRRGRVTLGASRFGPGERLMQRVRIEAAHLLLGDTEVLDRWEPRVTWNEDTSNLQGNWEVIELRLSVLGLFAEMTEDPLERGRALWPRLDPESPFREVRLYEPVSAGLEDGSIILPGEPAVRAEREALLARIASEKNIGPAFVVLAAAAALMIGLCALLRRMTRVWIS